MNNNVFLFPLPRSLLFKKVTLPFHVFESQFRKMIKDSMASQTPIAIVPPSLSNDYSGRICVAGIPHILSTYGDGRLDIYITGEIKCRLTNKISEEHYLSYEYIELMEENLVDVSFLTELESFRTLVERWSIHFLPDPIQREVFSQTLDDPELLINYCAVFLVDDYLTKKNIMEASSLALKVRILMSAIGPKEISLGPFMPILRF